MKKFFILLSASLCIGLASCSEGEKEVQSGKRIDNHTHEGHDATVDHEHGDHIHAAHEHKVQSGDSIDNHTHEGHDENKDHMHEDHVHEAHEHE